MALIRLLFGDPSPSTVKLLCAQGGGFTLVYLEHLGLVTEALSLAKRTSPSSGGAAMQLHSMTQTETRPDAMGDVPGICEIPLTRAVVQYRNLHEADASGGRIEDIGLALIVDGRFASIAVR